MSVTSCPSHDADKIVIRLPDGLRDRLKLLAKANQRSVNAEVVFHLVNVLAFRSASAAPLAAKEPADAP